MISVYSGKISSEFIRDSANKVLMSFNWKSLQNIFVVHAFFCKNQLFWLSLGLFLISPIHLLKILAKSHSRCSYKVCSYKEKKKRVLGMHAI